MEGETNMRKYDVEYTAQQMDKVATALHRAADEAAAAAADMRKSENFDAAGHAINSLLWVLPNLGLQTIHSSIVRELEREIELLS